MIKKVLIVLFSFTYLWSLDIPLNNVVNIDVKIGEFSVVEFPFEIKGTNKASFLPHTKKVKVGEKTTIKRISTPSPDSITVKRGKNTLTIFPKKYGKLNVVVWGYTKYPIMLSLNVVSSNASQYYRFIDYSKDIAKAKKFESTSHEKTVTKLIKHLFNNKTPPGYQAVSEGKNHKLNGLNFTLVNSLIGKDYRADEWVVKNLSKNKIELYEEMFYSEGIYAISFEADRLRALEKCRMFLIRKNLKTQ